MFCAMPQSNLIHGTKRIRWHARTRVTFPIQQQSQPWRRTLGFIQADRVHSQDKSLFQSRELLAPECARQLV